MVEHVAEPDGPRVVIEMWTDLGCPWCYLGKHRLRAAIAQRSDADRFEIVMGSFELDPGAPPGARTLWQAPRSPLGWTGNESARSSRATSTPTACAPTGPGAWSWALPGSRSLSSTAG